MPKHQITTPASLIYIARQQTKRWITIASVTITAGLLLLVLYLFLNPESWVRTASAQTQPITTIHLENFADVSSLTLNGIAAPVEDDDKVVLRLVPSEEPSGGGYKGSAFASNPVPLVIEGHPTSFSTHFQFRISDPGGEGTADGIVFAIAPDPESLGGIGLDIGYGGISPSLGVEFDDWYNVFDPNGNHVGINLNGDMTSVATANPSDDFDNELPWYAWIDFNGETNQLNVYLSSNAARPSSPLLSHTLSTTLVDLMGSDVAYVGFTSATAAGWANHDIRFWHFVAGPKLLDSMIWNAWPECPFCGSTSSVGWVGGPINTRNGNLSYQELDLSIPVLGGNL